MSENVEEKKECKCGTHCECIKKFFIVTLGSFIGVFGALSLFAEVHKPFFEGPKKGHRMHAEASVQKHKSDHKDVKAAKTSDVEKKTPEHKPVQK